MSCKRGNIIKQSEDQYQSHFITAEPGEENGQGGYLCLLFKKETENHLILFMFQTVQFHCHHLKFKERTGGAGEMFRPAVGSHIDYSGVKGNQSVKQQNTSSDSNKLWHISCGLSQPYVRFDRRPGVRTLLSMRCIKLLSNVKFPPSMSLLFEYQDCLAHLQTATPRGS